ncbi:hypothetical protein IFM89_038192 [Coptis chinensis]|uniref:Uncharacterized protein n=1 Tax=Coptis chinensis TaxID=261450 RepID=A0A835M601_9MAGN|nr:hypothetical protein IFM89_038192 [Coptis chinensis]
MNNVEEIITLLSQLASRIQTDPCPQLASLNQSLNLINEDESRVRVLHKALSLMCFKAPQVFDEELKCMVGTIVSVLNSCISCQVLSSFEKEECLRIGALISRGNCVKLIQACFGIAGKLEKHETLKEMLLGAVLRVAVSASCYEGLSPRTPVLSLESGCGINASLLEIQHLFHEDISVTNNKIPLRLLLWYLDPLTLKHDVSEVLREVVERPFLDLKKELHDRLTWRSVVVCLALSPTKFIETRTLLHNWFLITGLRPILEFQIKLVSSVLDVLSQPMGWSLSMEVGSQLPFSDAYFANEHNMLAVLLGPFSCESFLGLAHHIRESDILAQKCSHQTFEDNTTWKKLINYRSTWAQLIAFPEWFFFAAILLFSKNGCQFAFWSRCITSAVTTEHTCDAEQCCTAAARYLMILLAP